jgi:hypothetical protein
MDEIMKEVQEKREKVLKDFKVRKIAGLMDDKLRLEEEIKKVDVKIQEVLTLVVLPEGSSFSC